MFDCLRKKMETAFFCSCRVLAFRAWASLLLYALVCLEIVYS